MLDNHQEIYWKGWVTLYTKNNAAAKKERILVITNFRLLTVKQGVLKRSMRQSYPLLDLEEISASDISQQQIHLVFSSRQNEPEVIDIQSEQIIEIAQAIIFGFKAITYGIPPDRLPKVDLPQRFLENFAPPAPDAQDGILATYFAMCDYTSTPPKLSVLDYFMTAFETNDKEFDLGGCLATVEKPTSSDVLTIASALRYTNWFEELSSVDHPLRDEGLEHLSVIFSSSPQMRKCVVVNSKCGKNGINSLSRTLATGQHGLTYLNLSKNNFGDAGIKSLLDALSASQKVLETLCLQDCGFSARGFKSLTEVLRQGSWLKTLKVLDVSDNSAGKAGSQSLCEWLLETTALEQLHAMRCDLSMDSFMESLMHNASLSGNVLQTLNVSGNKVVKKSVNLTAQLLKQSSSLSHLYLVDCSLIRSSFIEIVEGALDNEHNVRIWLELSSNDLGDKGAKELAAVFDKHPHMNSIHTLILNNNAMAPEGVVAVLQSLRGKNIHTLSLDNNIKTGIFMAGAREAGEQIAQFINHTPQLKELSISGDNSHYLQSAAYPILEALKTNSTLQHIDLSRNRLGDDGIKLMCDALCVNKCLTSFNAERNRLSIKGLRELHKAVLQNITLVDWAIPMIDIENIYSNAPQKVVQELRNIVYDFESTMDRNWENRNKANASAESKNDDARTIDPARRMSATWRRPKHHTRTASDMFANFGKEKNPDDRSLESREDLVSVPETQTQQAPQEEQVQNDA